MIMLLVQMVMTMWLVKMVLITWLAKKRISIQMSKFLNTTDSSEGHWSSRLSYANALICAPYNSFPFFLV